MKLKKKRLVLMVGASIILASAIFQIVRIAHRELLRVGTMGTIPSILAFVYEMDEKQLQALDISLSEEWSILSTEQYDAIIEATKEDRRLDVDASRWTKNAKFVDPWGQSYLIAGRKKENVREFIVWSKGPDGLSGTKDDIVRPYKSIVPRNIRTKTP